MKQEGLLQKETMQAHCSLSVYEMEQIYAQGYHHYQNNLLDEAENAFRLLVWLNPYKSKYWMGLAATLQMVAKYEEALHAYAVCTLLDEKNPYPHYHALNCYLALDDREEAKKALDCALGLAQQQGNRELIEELVQAKGDLL